MDIEQIKLMAKGTPLDAYIGFKIDVKAKEELIRHCNKHGLSVGRAVRMMIDQFNAEMRK